MNRPGKPGDSICKVYRLLQNLQHISSLWSRPTRCFQDALSEVDYHANSLSPMFAVLIILI